LTQTQNDTVSMNGWLEVITGVEFNCSSHAGRAISFYILFNTAAA